MALNESSDPEMNFEVSPINVASTQKTLIILLSWSVVRRKKSEANLLASEYFLSSVLDNLPDIVFVKDAETLRFVRINKTAERYFGRTAEEIVGKSDYDFFPPDEADFFTKKDKETLEKQLQVNIPLLHLIYMMVFL